MDEWKKYRRMVIKVGTSTLTHDTGALHLHRIETLVKVLSDFANDGKEVIFVSSGAVSAGVAKAALGHMPSSTEEKQAAAAIGQSELMKIYDRFFSDYGHTVAQILLTKDIITQPERRHAAENTFKCLLGMKCIPVVNENDSVSTDELTKFGGNDILSAYVAIVTGADVLINMSDIDGLFDSDPRLNPDAKLISRVDDISAVEDAAGGAVSRLGTGGMAAKLRAARIAVDAGIPMYIVNGHNPEVLYSLVENGNIGTYFPAKE